jgi:hypothetical protein
MFLCSDWALFVLTSTNWVCFLAFSYRLGLDLSCVVHWRMQQLMMCMSGCCQIIICWPLIIVSISAEFLYSYDWQYSETLLWQQRLPIWITSPSRRLQCELILVFYTSGTRSSLDGLNFLVILVYIYCSNLRILYVAFLDLPCWGCPCWRPYKRFCCSFS